MLTLLFKCKIILYSKATVQIFFNITDSIYDGDEDCMARDLKRLIDVASMRTGTSELDDSMSEIMSAESEADEYHHDKRRKMAVAIESGRVGKGKGKDKGKGKWKGKASENGKGKDTEPANELDIVKTCKCICPIQHALMGVEYENAMLNKKRIKLEILKLERDLNTA
jgi:hypothetical protein